MPVTTLKTQWQAARQQRQQAVIQRRQQTCDQLSRWQDQRLDEATQQRLLLQKQLASLQQEVSLHLDQLGHNRQLQAQQQYQARLSNHRELESATSDLRLKLIQELQPIQQRVASLRQQNHAQQAALRSQLRTELAAYRGELQRQVATTLKALTADRLSDQALRQHQRQQAQQVLTADIADFRQACRRSAIALKLQVWGQPDAVAEPPTTSTAAKAPTPAAPAQSASVVAQHLAVRSTVGGLAPANPLPNLAQPQAAVPQATVLEPVTLAAAASVSEPTSLEEALYNFLHQCQGARLQEIQTSLKINRFQAIDTLRSLIQKQLVSQTDRIYHVHEEAVL